MNFRELKLEDLSAVTTSIDEDAYQVAREIVADVFQRGELAIREFAAKYDGMGEQDNLFVSREELQVALDQIETETRELLQRTAERIRSFAQHQRESIQDVSVEVPGGHAGHRWLPLQSAGCYAPAGRYPLPSSVLMTAVTARVAGVKQVWVASPKPNAITLAAAAVAEADGVLTVGGAQAIAALAAGVSTVVPPCDVVVGPGNRYVTAAKWIVSRFTKIDMLAGPSELVVVAGEDANPAFVAADLLAQAEHDVDARPILITDSKQLLADVKTELEKQLGELPTSQVAVQALSAGGYCLVSGLDEAVECCEVIAPEHLSLQGSTFESNADLFRAGAALFVGAMTPEVLGDYGAGPNHVLPTGGTARSQSGLSVFTFMRCQTRLQIESPKSAHKLFADARMLGETEGLTGHARSSEIRSDAIQP